MSKKYPVGTKLRVTEDGSKSFYLDVDEDFVDPNIIIIVARSSLYTNSYNFENATDEVGWNPAFIEDTTCFKPVKFTTWKQRYQ